MVPQLLENFEVGLEQRGAVCDSEGWQARSITIRKSVWLPLVHSLYSEAAQEGGVDVMA